MSVLANLRLSIKNLQNIYFGSTRYTSYRSGLLLVSNMTMIKKWEALNIMINVKSLKQAMGWIWVRICIYIKNYNQSNAKYDKTVHMSYVMHCIRGRRLDYLYRNKIFLVSRGLVVGKSGTVLFEYSTTNKNVPVLNCMTLNTELVHILTVVTDWMVFSTAQNHSIVPTHNYNYGLAHIIWCFTITGFWPWHKMWKLHLSLARLIPEANVDRQWQTVGKWEMRGAFTFTFNFLWFIRLGTAQ